MSGEPLADRHVPTGDAWPAEMLRSIWQRQRHLVLERVSLMEQAAAAIADERMDDSSLPQAKRAAHMLAGSIGTFGFTRSSQAARTYELLVDQAKREDAPALSWLAACIRDEIETPSSNARRSAGD